MKRENRIKYFTFTVRSGELKIRVINSRNKPIIMDLPREDVMDTDNDTPDVCGICLAPHVSPMLTTKCGHKLHQRCLKTWFSTSAISCPVCRTIPDTVNEDIVSCTRCRRDYLSMDAIQDMDSSLCLTRKCGHYHDRRCQTKHLQELTEEFPHNPAMYDRLIASQHPGCYTCKKRIDNGDNIETDLTCTLAKDESEQTINQQGSG